MKRFILSLCVAICTLLAINTATAQSIPKEALPEFVTEMKTMLPQEVAPGMVFTNASLQNSNSQLVFDFKLDLKKMSPDYEITSAEIISEMEGMTPAQKRSYLGEEFGQIATLIPIPMYIVFNFMDGKSYKMKVSD